jgi:hypothetical protein
MTPVSLAVVLVLGTQAPTQAHVGGFVPNSQLLTWCKSNEAAEYAQCWAFIEAVVEATGMADTKWPKGRVELPDSVFGPKLIPTVVQHIEQLDREKMSRPAVRSVYDAVVALYPYNPPAADVRSK